MDLSLEDAERAAMRTQWSGLAAWAPVVGETGGWTALGCAALPEHPWLNQVAGRGDGLDEALDVLAGAGVVRVATTVAGPAPRRLAQRGLAPASGSISTPGGRRRSAVPGGRRSSPTTGSSRWPAAGCTSAGGRPGSGQGAEQVGVKVEPGSVSHRNLEREGFRPAHQVVLWSGRLRGATRRRAAPPAPT